MPETKKEPSPRVTVCIPRPLIAEVDELVRMYAYRAESRQKFVEEAIRSRIWQVYTEESTRRARIGSRVAENP